MTVFFVERTGHVLGAVTRNSGDDPASRKGPIPEDVLIRFIDGSQALIAGKELSALVVAPLPDLLLAPLYFHAPKAPDAPPGTEPRPKDVKRLPKAPVTVTLAAAGITVDLGHDATKNENVWLLIVGGTLAEPFLAEGTIKEQTSSIFIPGPGLTMSVNYQILVLVEDHSTFLNQLTTT
jgi:hypothetical protein